MNTIPPQDELRRLLDYDPETGVFTWKYRGDLFWDRRWAGKTAFPCFNVGYRVGSLGGKRGVLAHRVAYKYMTGRDAECEVDHINGDRSDNRWSNLRAVTNTENRRNSARPRTNTSGIVGVSYTKGKRKWKAYIHLGNRMIHLGYFPTKEEAATARASAEAENGFHPNHGRALSP